MRFFHLKFDDAKMTKSQYRSYLRREGGSGPILGFFNFLVQNFMLFHMALTIWLKLERFFYNSPSTAGGWANFKGIF